MAPGLHLLSVKGNASFDSHLSRLVLVRVWSLAHTLLVFEACGCLVVAGTPPMSHA